MNDYKQQADIYFKISRKTENDPVTIETFSKESLAQHLNEIGYNSWPKPTFVDINYVLSNLETLDNLASDNILLIKGSVCVPKEVSIVTEYVVEE